MKNIKITIVTITYNSEKTVRETFESIKRQGYDNLEYIIIDGGSTDATLKIAEEYSDLITEVISEKDNGISDAMNKGIKRASGDLIGIIHSDDMLADNALSMLNTAWDGEADVYYGNAIICDQNGKKTHILKSKSDLSEMPYRFVIVHPATFVTKKAYEKYGVFDLKYKCAMDYDLLLRFYRDGAKFKYIDDSLAIYRAGGTNQKYRKKTIDEICQISVLHGGNIFRANLEKWKKKVKDRLSPVLRYFHITNGRVVKI